MAAILEDGKLRLSGYVGDYHYDDHFTSSDVVLALAQIDASASLVVHVNSAGGIASEGAAIHALLSARSGITDVVIEGIAMSAASLIAMAGATVTMSAGAVLMIHDPENITWGNSAEHAKTIDQLEALATSYARIYADKSGKTIDECREIMKAETWLTPTQAVEAGFADETTEKRAEPVAAFDYRILENAPKRLRALAAKKDWRLPGADKGAAPAAENRQHKESSMSDNKNGGDESPEIKKLREELATMKSEKAARDNRDAIMALPEAKGREAQATALADAGVDADKAKAVLLAGGDLAPNPDQSDAARYEASRAAGAGMSGGGKSTAPTAPTMSANMRKLIGKEAA